MLYTVVDHVVDHYILMFDVINCCIFIVVVILVSIKPKKTFKKY